ncbi:hypothetical protein [Virgibacillus salidurans]|nr:hypothetical protein [Virgibacillus sp. NKC19-16]
MGKTLKERPKRPVTKKSRSEHGEALMKFYREAAQGFQSRKKRT